MDTTALSLRIVFCLLGTAVLTGVAVTQSNIQNTNFSDSHYANTSNNVPPLQRKGNDKDIEKIMLPMLLGLKLSGLATATFTILKIFVLQSLMASKVALLGAVVLVLKALYVYLRDKYWKTKVPQLETYSYPGVMFPHHLPQWDWSEAYNPYSLPEDYHSQASGADHVIRPYPYPYPTYHNDSFAVKADRVKLTTSSPPANKNKPYITRITETTYD